MAVALLVVGVGACGKTEPSPGSGASALADAAQGAPSSTAARAEAGAAALTRREWHGTYASVAGEVTIPAALKGVHWTVPASDAGIGEGTLTLRAEDTRRISGTLDGPLGPATIDGVFSDTFVSASIVRTDPADRGFTGTLTGTIEGATLKGTLHVSLAEASAVRSATFALSSGT